MVIFHGITYVTRYDMTESQVFTQYNTAIILKLNMFKINTRPSKKYWYQNDLLTLGNIIYEDGSLNPFKLASLSM
jgi:hypothetical protein